MAARKPNLTQQAEGLRYLLKRCVNSKGQVCKTTLTIDAFERDCLTNAAETIEFFDRIGGAEFARDQLQKINKRAQAQTQEKGKS